MHTVTFEKPLNPVLGETLHGLLEDGAELYAEQTSHHPPVSHYYVEGPNKNYTMHGYYNYTANAGLNSLTINNVGKKSFIFPDGQTITHNLPNEIFSGTFFGIVRQETLGVIEFIEAPTGYTARIQFGGIQNMASDYITGEIRDPGGETLSTISGTYCGYLEIDGVRYWDARHVRPYEFSFDGNLASDSEVRTDLVALRRGDVEIAQQAKEDIENLQRHDRKLRAQYAKTFAEKPVEKAETIEIQANPSEMQTNEENQ